MGAVRAGSLRLHYVAPERFNNERFRESVRRVRVSRFAVDEAHCISEWGHNFRPEYLDVGLGQICGIAADKSLWCWGTVDLATLIETGVREQALEPVRIGTANDWSLVKVGWGHISALRSDGSLWTWGFGPARRINGQIGDGGKYRATVSGRGGGAARRG